MGTGRARSHLTDGVISEVAGERSELSARRDKEGPYQNQITLKAATPSLPVCPTLLTRRAAKTRGRGRRAVERVMNRQ